MIDWSWAWWLPLLLEMIEGDETGYVWLASRKSTFWGLVRIAEFRCVA